MGSLSYAAGKRKPAVIDMDFLPAELIRKKRFGGTHTREELRFLIQNYAAEKLPDYQMAAWLMAVCFQGMTPEETAWLTQEMRDSGEVMDLKSLGTTVDKHSTGGIGDKTSLILAPLGAAAGLKVPMMAGRGLAHTGGTLDKLESLSGFKVGLTLEQFRTQISSLGTAIIGQTPQICPADRKLYALRDVTGTVDSLPLICGSIMSKKLAEGATALVLDVKYGSGAFMKTREKAVDLARALKDIGDRSGQRVIALITRMDEPLGRFVGNACEVRECLDIMAGKRADSGKGYEDTIELTLELAAYMLFLGGRARDEKEGREIAKRHLQDGSALAKFKDMVKAQSGDLESILRPAALTKTVTAESDGYFQYIDIEKIGTSAIFLGAGRKFQSDKLDFTAGIEIYKKNGDPVKKGETLFKLFGSADRDYPAAQAELKRSFLLTSQPVTQSPLIAEVLK